MIRQIIHSNIILLIQYAVGSLVPLILVPHIVNVIGLAEYGHLSVLMAWGSYGAVVVRYAFHMTGPKRIVCLAIGESKASIFIDIAFAKFLLLIFVLSVMVVCVFFSPPLQSGSSLAWTILFIMPVAAGFNSVWFLQSQNRFLPICILAIMGSLITLFIGFVFVTSTNPKAIDYAVIVNFFGTIFISIGTVLLSIFLLKDVQYKVSLLRAINELRDGYHLFISQFVSIFYTASGPIIINYLIDAKAAGAYSVTERVINAIMAAVMLTHTAAYPRLASSYIHNRSEYWRMLKFILTGYVCIALILVVFAWFLQQPLIKFLYGEANSAHESLLLWGGGWLLLGVFGTALTGFLTVSGRSREIWPLTLKILALSVSIGIPSVLLFGSVGWMAALVLSQVLVLQTGFKYWRREYGK